MTILPRSRPQVSPRNPERRSARAAVLPAHSGGAVGVGQVRLALVAGRRLQLAVLAGVAVLAGPVPLLRAFPPAPYYTIYGDARDQYGILIPAGSASVVLYANGKETAREALTNTPGDDFNYQIRVRIDMLRENSASYSSQALNTGKIFTIGIESGGKIFYPLEMATPPAIGSASDRRRLNLTLGVDSDGDGLPDAWEESQLYQGGVLPGTDGWDLSLIDRTGDLDRDGVSNGTEYLAGTYAADASSVLGLQIKEKLETAVRLEFYAIYGKSYVLQASSDLKQWSDATFVLTPPGADPPDISQSSLLSTRTGITSLYTGVAAASPSTYYRLAIR